MDADERDIAYYLKRWPGQFVSMSEIARRAGGKRRYRAEPDWAVQVLLRMAEKGWVESDSAGHYRLVRKAKDKRSKPWVSPQIQKILEQSGKTYEIRKVDDDDDFEWLNDADTS